jgi:hypothetical protein
MEVYLCLGKKYVEQLGPCIVWSKSPEVQATLTRRDTYLNRLNCNTYRVSQSSWEHAGLTGHGDPGKAF